MAVDIAPVVDLASSQPGHLLEQLHAITQAEDHQPIAYPRKRQTVDLVLGDEHPIHQQIQLGEVAHRQGDVAGPGKLGRQLRVQQTKADLRLLVAQAKASLEAVIAEAGHALVNGLLR